MARGVLTGIVLALVSCAPMRPVLPLPLSRVIGELGPPPIRVSVDARRANELVPEARILEGLDADVRPLVDRVEFLGYYAGERTVERFVAINGVVVARQLVVIPELTVAEPGELGRTGRAGLAPVGVTSAALVERWGTPAAYRRDDGGQEVLQFDVGEDLVLAFAVEQKVWSVFTLRIAPELEPNYRNDFATIIMEAFMGAGDGLDLGSNREHVMHMLRAGVR